MTSEQSGRGAWAVSLAVVIAWWSLCFARPTAFFAVATCVMVLALYVGRDTCVLLRLDGLVPHRGSSRAPIPDQARRLSAARLVVLLGLVLSVAIWRVPAVLAVGAMVCALTSAVTRAHFEDWYGGPSWLRTLLVDLLPQAFPGWDGRREARRLLQPLAWTVMAIGVLGTAMTHESAEEARSTLAAVGVPSILTAISSVVNGDEGASPSSSTTTSPTTTDTTSSTVATTTSTVARTTSSTLALINLCGSAKIPLHSPTLEPMRARLEDRWHLPGGAVVGCPDEVEALASGVVVVWFRGGESDPSALVAWPDVPLATLVQEKRAPVLQRLIDSSQLTGAYELELTGGADFQVFLIENDRCVLAVDTYGPDGSRFEELSPAASSAVLDLVATMGGTLQSLVQTETDSGAKIELGVELLGQSIDILLIEDQDVRLTGGPRDLVGMVTPQGATCPETVLLEVASRS